MKKVLIIFGGNSSEHYISCKSCKSIIENIDDKQFKYEVVGISFDGMWYKFNDDLSYLETGKWLDSNVLLVDNIVSYLKSFDVVFPITHGNNGEDGKLQGFLDLFNIKYVGCDTYSSVVGFDKSLSKLFFASLDIPQVPYIVINEDYKITEIINKLGFPVIVKPARGGSSIGISKANNKKELIKAIKIAKRYDEKLVIEKFIKARELECAILTSKYLLCSKLGEIKSSNEFYDYDAKYINKSECFICDDLPTNVTDKITEYVSKVFIELNCKSFARIDFFYDEISGNIYINEINTIPGFTPISMYPVLMKDENISYKELITTLINNV